MKAATIGCQQCPDGVLPICAPARSCLASADLQRLGLYNHSARIAASLILPSEMRSGDGTRIFGVGLSPPGLDGRMRLTPIS